MLQGLEALPQYQLEEKLVVYFGADVDGWLHNTVNAPQRRIVLLYDTYEALWRDSPNKTDPLVDKWVRKLVGETPGVLHVMLGRETLTWANHDPAEWQDIITPYPLDNLTDTDADSFLQAVPIVEDDIRTRIVESAKGVPFYLSLQVDQYEGSKRRGIIPQVQDYGGKEPEILARFISHLPDAMRSALRVAAYPRWLDATLFLNLSGKFLGGAAVISLHELTTYSFWTKQADRYFLHAVMRDYLQMEYLEREATLYRNIHQYLFEHYDRKLQALTSARELTEEHTEAINEGAYHLEAIARPKTPYWVGKYREMFHLAGQWITLEPLLTRSLQILEEIGDQFGEGTTINNISQIYCTRCDYNTALDLFNKSIIIQQKIDDKSGESITLNNISQIHHNRGDYDTALEFLKKSLAIQQKIGDKFGEGITLNNISQIHHDRNDYDTALKFIKRSLAIQQRIGDKFGESTTLNNISRIYYARGDFDVALEYFKRSLSITQEIGDKKGMGITLNNISQIYDIRGNYNTALEYLQQSLVIQQEIGDKAGLCATLFNIAAIHWKNCEQDEAKRKWLKVYSIAKQINLAQALQALESIAGQLSLSDGLQGWEMLAQQMEQTEEPETSG
ncbi:MAG: tetratricopeptide repeat protein [Thiothrix sp.]|uniref:tetratricopeptide repeat protein n=1 Tax=Thiothrix sp. TaxID=1032 RepID=UPI00261DD676|nr:tetratricopeptide repeat protein [Thiothrix sp.]MDD5392989.1 tetratricopeptide repeat protein [Thiothrix sp.]